MVIFDEARSGTVTCRASPRSMIVLTCLVGLSVSAEWAPMAVSTGYLTTYASGDTIGVC